MQNRNSTNEGAGQKVSLPDPTRDGEEIETNRRERVALLYLLGHGDSKTTAVRDKLPGIKTSSHSTRVWEKLESKELVERYTPDSGQLATSGLNEGTKIPAKWLTLTNRGAEFAEHNSHRFRGLHAEIEDEAHVSMNAEAVERLDDEKADADEFSEFKQEMGGYQSKAENAKETAENVEKRTEEAIETWNSHLGTEQNRIDELVERVDELEEENEELRDQLEETQETVSKWAEWFSVVNEDLKEVVQWWRCQRD